MRGSSSRTTPVPVSRRVALPSPASTDSGSSSIAPAAVLKLVWSTTEIGTPALATCAGGPNSTLAVPVTPGVARSAASASFAVDLEAGMGVAAAGQLHLKRLLGRQLAVTSRNGRPPVVPSTRQGPASVCPSICDVLGKELVGPPGRRPHRGDEQLPDGRFSNDQSRRKPPARFGRQRKAAVAGRRDADARRGRCAPR